MNYDDFGNVTSTVSPCEEKLQGNIVIQDILKHPDYHSINPWASMVPPNVDDFYRQLLVQKRLHDAGSLMSEALEMMKLEQQSNNNNNNNEQLTDDQRRVQKIKERLMKKRQQK